jgi:hypothetical protein
MKTTRLSKSLQAIHARILGNGIIPHPHSYDWHDGHTDHHNPRPWEQVAAAPVLLKNSQIVDPGPANDYSKYAAAYGQLTGKPSNLLHYDYNNKLPAIQDLVRRHGFQVHYAGGKYGAPDHANKNYNTGHLTIHDSGLNDNGYTHGWRQLHELAHALTHNELNNTYGEGRRTGQLGHHRTLNEAMRAVHWEHLAAHKQRELSRQIGVHLTDEDFNKEYNTIMHDAVHRAITGKFAEPSREGFVPHSHPVPLAASLDLVRGAGEQLGLRNQHDIVQPPATPRIQIAAGPNRNSNK